MLVHSDFHSIFFPAVKVNVDQQLFGYPDSSKYLLTDVNVCGAVQYIDMAAPELQLIECAGARCNNISSKADRGDIFIRAAAGQMGALSRILLLCPLPQILWNKKNTYHNRTLIKYKSK